MNPDSHSTIGGVTRGAFPWWLLQREVPGKMLVVMPEEDVLDFVDDSNALTKLPEGWPKIKPTTAVGYPADDEASRQVSLHRWFFEGANILVCSWEGASLPCDPPDQLQTRSLLLRPGFTMKRLLFEEKLAQAAYARVDRIELMGEYSVRGEVMDIWLAGEPGPIRITWNLDTIEALRQIDLYSQRSEAYLKEMWLCPILAGSGSTVLSDLPFPVQIFSFEKECEVSTLKNPSKQMMPVTLVTAALRENSNEGFEPPPVFTGHIQSLKEQLLKWQGEDWRVAVFCHNQGEVDRLEELLEEAGGTRGLKPAWWPACLIGELEHGFLHPGHRLAVLANSEIFGRYRKRVRLPKFEGGGVFSSVMDLKPNDFLVHERHGIGRYRGLKTLRVGSVTSEYLSIEYKGGDKIYVPIFELQQVQKYLGAEGRRPALSSLDSPAWERTKAKVKEDVIKLAGELLRQAAKRTARPGYAFPPRTHLEEEFASSFIYKLTPDQTRTLDEVEKDMSLPKAMDRLICGDVGYGKTEVAMRAALKCALTGKQAALLCPTTILAEQHYQNFKERLADYPVTLGLLSRFQTASEQKKILKSLQSGGVDIIIGTHRLFSVDVAFKDVGLLIIDEEHRFGVKQKNKLLHMRETVDVLSLTATPIPRTLATVMGGIKDLSVIETAPEGRLPILTHVGPFDEDLMTKAVQNELDRSGQVFYVHDRVKTLSARKEWLESIFPSIRIGMVHGQMREGELEESMHKFLHKNIDLLLTTTIIESGLDIPSVNTLIVEGAEDMGLAQLYQLRGRVGRSPRRAYSYLFFTPQGVTQEAKKRLEALKEFTALGSGFRLAMRDMEIRGAGNLLGPEQHGNMVAVGLETYSQLLEEEVRKMQGETAGEEKKGPLLEISVSSYIPDDYLPSESERIVMYKKVLNARREELLKVQEELVDRCGPLPEPARLLFDVARLRMDLQDLGIAEVHEESDNLLIYFKKNFKLNDRSFQILLSQKDDVLNFIPGDPPGVRFFLIEKENVIESIRRFLKLVFPE